ANFCIRIRLCEKGNARKGHANAAVAAAPARKNCLRLIINLLDKCTRSHELAESGLGGASWTPPPAKASTTGSQKRSLGRPIMPTNPTTIIARLAGSGVATGPGVRSNTVLDGTLTSPITLAVLLTCRASMPKLLVAARPLHDVPPLPGARKVQTGKQVVPGPWKKFTKPPLAKLKLSVSGGATRLRLPMKRRPTGL